MHVDVPVQRLAQRVAIVTGGTAGLGRSACHALAREGARVVVVGRDADRLAAVTEALGEYDIETLGLRLDVCSEDDMQEMARRTIDRFERIDILITSAGILRTPGSGMKTLAQTSIEAWDGVVDTNLRGTFLSIRAVLPQMTRQRSGDILTLSSKSGRTGLAFDGAYCASKFGLIGLTESVRQETEGAGVRVQVLLPGTFDTNLWDQNRSMPRPKDLPPPERVADLMIEMIALPRDTYLAAPLIEPVRSVALPDWSAPREHETPNRVNAT